MAVVVFGSDNIDGDDDVHIFNPDVASLHTYLGGMSLEWLMFFLLYMSHLFLYI